MKCLRFPNLAKAPKSPKSAIRFWFRPQDVPVWGMGLFGGCQLGGKRQTGTFGVENKKLVSWGQTLTNPLDEQNYISMSLSIGPTPPVLPLFGTGEELTHSTPAAQLNRFAMQTEQ